MLSKEEIAMQWGGAVTDHVLDQKKVMKLAKDWKWKTDCYTRGAEMIRQLPDKDC